MTDYIKLAGPPEWCVSYPTCSACHVDLDYGDDWMCPVCGTRWSSPANDGDEGELYESWSGEELAGETITNDEAWRIGLAREREWRDAYVAKIMAKNGA